MRLLKMGKNQNLIYSPKGGCSFFGSKDKHTTVQFTAYTNNISRASPIPDPQTPSLNFGEGILFEFFPITRPILSLSIDFNHEAL